MQHIQHKHLWFTTLRDSVYDRETANFWLQKINPLWSTHQCLGKIISKKFLTRDMVGLQVRCNQHMQFGRAGQHHPIKVDIAGRRYERSYSLTQLDEHHVQINVKKVANGIVSNWFCTQARIGDLIEFGRPYGDMTFPALHQPLLMIAAGSGITPMYSMLHNLAASGALAHAKITLLYWAKQQQDFAFKKQFSLWQNLYADFSVHYFCTQDSPFNARINSEHLLLTPQLKQQQVFICGPSGFVQSATQIFAQAKQIQSEAFSLSPLSTKNESGSIQLTLTQSNKTVTIDKGQPILLGLEQANIRPTHGCRMGICNKCACNKVQGQTKNLQDGSSNHEANQDIRICINSAQSDLILDL